jgi:hypothetical protein
MFEIHVVIEGTRAKHVDPTGISVRVLFVNVPFDQRNTRHACCYALEPMHVSCLKAACVRVIQSNASLIVASLTTNVQSI